MKDNALLRRGYTTGSCAAAAAKAAVTGLLTGQIPARVSLNTPAGIPLLLQTKDAVLQGEQASCAVRKDAGDDPDVTHDLLIYATAMLTQDGQITINGGIGVGRVTRPGLDQPVGAAAINHVPREMIEREVRLLTGKRGARITIDIPAGAALAKRTYNPRLGIEGGLSVLGTTGIVEPMSTQALVDSIHTELNMLRAESAAPVLITPGAYGEQFATEHLRLPLCRAVLCSNYLGETLEYAQSLGFEGALLVGHAGKLVKLAGGIFQTHSAVADARMEIITAHAALVGITANQAKTLLACVSVDAAFELLEKLGLLKQVCASLIQKIEQHLRHKTTAMPVEAVLFSHPYGILGQTGQAHKLLEQIKQTEETR